MQRNIDMVTATYKFLHFANLKDIPNWSVQYADEEDLGFTKKFPMARIGSFLVKSRDIIEVQDDVEYKQVTLKINNGGVVPRNNGATLKGSKIGTKRQHVIHAGQFILSKIDARNGAYGIVPSELEGAIVTNDFPVFDVDTKKIIPQFLVLVSTTNKFVEFARKCSSGTTNRKRIDIDAFLNQQIPLPSIEEQETILEEYNSCIQSAAKKEREIDECEKDISQYILSSIGKTEIIEELEEDQSSLLVFTSLSKLTRWDTYNIKYHINKEKGTTLLRELVKSKPFYGAPYSAVDYNKKIRYIRITDINEDGTLSEEKVSANQYNDAYLLKENDFLIARSGNTVGKTFLYSSSFGPAIFAGYLIKFELQEELIFPQYLLVYTKTSLFKKWIKNNQRVSAQPNINCQQYLEAPIILPTMEKQKEIVEYVSQKQQQKIQLATEVKRIREQAEKQFTHSIFDQ